MLSVCFCSCSCVFRTNLFRHVIFLPVSQSFSLSLSPSFSKKGPLLGEAELIEKVQREKLKAMSFMKSKCEELLQVFRSLSRLLARRVRTSLRFVIRLCCVGRDEKSDACVFRESELM